MHNIFYRITVTAKQHWLLLVILAITSGFHLHWVFTDTSPQLWDIAGHSYRSATYADLIANGKLFSVLRFETIYPPLQYLVTVPFYWVFGWHAWVPQLSLIVWIWLLGISLYAISWKLFQRRDIAALSVIAIGFMPLLQHMSHVYFLDFSLTATVTAFVACVLYSRGGTRRGWVLLAAIMAAATLLIKWVALLFLLAPVAIALWDWLQLRQNTDSEYKPAARNSIYGIICAAMLLTPWYVLNTRTVLESAVATRNNIFSVPYENLFSVGNVLYYIERTIFAVGWHTVVFAAVGLIALWYTSRKHLQYRSLLFIVLWILLPYLVMTFLLHSKESRYILPIYPAIALLAAYTVTLFTKRIGRVIVIALMLCAAIFVQLELATTRELVPSQLHSIAEAKMNYLYRSVTPQDPRYGVQHPTQFNSLIHKIPLDIITHLEKHPLPVGQTVNIAVVPNSMYLTAQQIQFLAVISGLDRTKNNWLVDYSISSSIRDGDNYFQKLSNADFIITKTGDQGPAIWGPQLQSISTMEQEQIKNGEGFFSELVILSEYALDGLERESSSIRLYANPRAEK